ncbi:uncharacterized protein N7511_003320 [Penicillium nucicola]|uniref:uncharacterized protein n=1 Tax=Penicillium nucicola TaxID=1850975 RepID=UPI002545883C|nr:uncharacterized protein N7511_003320 [Penicillium nucicola]KAJ5771269.1 hypothetical protein N7511_003320 [Penicillium nucicola]
MEAKASELLAAFKNPNLSVDSKVAYLTSVKSDIKQKNVPEGAIATIFETLRLAISSQHYSVCGAGFSTLGHLLKRLTIQDQQQWIVNQARNLYTLLLERLNDHKERIRAQAASIFTDLWPVAGSEVEYYVLEVALIGKNPRAKEMSMLWLSNMTKNHGLLYRQHVPALVACLEDADSGVRDTAKQVVIELFRSGPARAKSDLQKQITARGVRKSIANSILSAIGLGSTDPEAVSSARPISRAERPISVMSSRSHAVDHTEDEMEPVKRPASRAHRERSAAPSAPVEAPTYHRSHTPAGDPPAQKPLPDDDGLEPFDVASARDIDDLVRDMLPWFEGRESEDNWSKREKNVILFRRLTRGNAPHDFMQTYINATKTLLDGIFKVVNSLRTTMSTNGSLLIQDIARTCGPRIDSMVEIIMQNLMKLCSALKKIAAQNGNAAVDAVIENVSFSIRLLQHVSFASQDKNVQVRLFATGWLKTLITRQAHQKSTVEHGGGLDLVEKAIKKGLADANPAVREASRSTFWTFFSVWPERAEAIMNTLDAKSRTLLEKDGSNPNGGPRPASALPAKSPTKSRTALQEAIAARKRAQTPSRPESAQPALSVQQAFPEAKPPAAARPTRTVPTGAPLSSLSSAPMRPGMKPRRAELSRPATADPYARRPESRTQSTHPSSASKPPTSSPRSVKSKPSTPNAKPLTAPRIRPHEANPSGPAKGRPKKLDLSKSKSHNDLGAASRARSDSNDSLTNPSSARTPRTPRTPRYDNHLSASEDHHSPPQFSPASAVFDSPQFSASQPMLHSAPHGTHIGSVPVDEPEPMVLEEYAEPAVMPPSPRIAEPYVAAPIDAHLIPVPESVSKPHSDPMIIYEDPATPTTPTTPTRTRHSHSIGHLTPSRSSIPTRSPIRSPVRSPARSEQLDQHATEPETVLEDASTSTMSSAKRSTPELAPSHDSALNFEARTPSPTRRAPLQPTPSPSRGHVQPAASNIVTGVDSMDLEDTPVGSPETHCTESHGSNENATPHMSKVVDLPVPRSVVKPTALEEVPVNESTPRPANVRERSMEAMSQSILSSSTPDDSTRRIRKFNDRHRSPSPRSKDPANAREMIHKALARIASRTMEPSGYRKLQALFQYHGEEIVPRSQEYNAMLEALLGELESVPTSRKDHDVKTQVLATIRSMLLRTREQFQPYDMLAMSAFIRARQHYESSSHFVTCLEEVTDKLVFLTLPQTAITGVLQALDLGEDAETDETHRSIIMGLNTIQQSLTRPKVEVADDLLASIGAVVMQQLGHPRPGVRKSATELCTFLNLTFGSERVQKVTQPPREGSLNLLTYFMARRSQ